MEKLYINGMVHKLALVPRRSDGQLIAFFQLINQNNMYVYDCMCFVENYNRLKAKIKENKKIFAEVLLDKNKDRYTILDAITL